MNKIKALFFDLDGTLLDPQKKITHQTRKTLEACKTGNIKLFIATARPPLLDKMLSWDDKTLSLFDGGVYYNGGCVIVDGKKTYTPISDDIVQKSIRHVKQYENLNIALQLEHEKHAFRFPLDKRGYRGWGVPAENALNLKGAKGLHTVKILVFYSNLIDSVVPVDKALVETLAKLCRDTAQFYLTDKEACVQIMAQGVNKHRGIEKIRAYLGYEKNEIAVFGDDVNDIEVLAEYENSIAMGNAECIVKERARYITLDNENDGVHHGICNILKLVKA